MALSLTEQEFLAAVKPEQGVELQSLGRSRDAFKLNTPIPHWRSGTPGDQYEMEHANVPAGVMIAFGGLDNLPVTDLPALKMRLEGADIYNAMRSV